MGGGVVLGNKRQTTSLQSNRAEVLGYCSSYGALRCVSVWHFIVETDHQVPSSSQQSRNPNGGRHPSLLYIPTPLTIFLIILRKTRHKKASGTCS